ncbi:hypothetical protein ADMFC3_19080 [Geovibrio sp. ADMFC3]
MNRSVYYNRITYLLATLTVNIHQRAKNNILDYNIHAESFYGSFLKLLYNWDFTNANKIFQNAAAIDLIDEKNKLIVQVTSQDTKSKINTTLSKEKLKGYQGYSLKFFIITDDGKDLKSGEYNNPHNITFDPKKDILDNGDILRAILAMKIDEQEAIHHFLSKELRPIEMNMVNMESDLVKIIEILSKEDLDNCEQINLNEYNIEEKINFNLLQRVKEMINTHKIYYNIIEKIFIEYDKAGNNKSLAIKLLLKKKYMKLMDNEEDKVVIFWTLLEEVKEYIKSFDVLNISLEELDMYVSILIIHAFVWCHIFENPTGYTHVTT